MLSIQPPKPSPPQKVTPNLLPLRISHNGPINSTERFFKPTSSAGSSNTTQGAHLHAHFRGRHLHGTTVALPEGYTGAVLHVTDKPLLQPQSQREQQKQHVQDNGDSGGEDEDAGALLVEVNIAEQVGEFDGLVVWGHGGAVDESRNTYVRGLGEWVGFAESMHCDEDEHSPWGRKA